MTLNDILLRCYVDEDSGCWHWRGAVHHRTQLPVIYIRPKNRWGRRVVFNLAHGKPFDAALPSGRYTTLKCDTHKCLNPEHIKVTTKSAYMKKVRPSLQARLRMLAAQRKRPDLKLSLEMARQMRGWAAEGMATAEIARRMKVSKTTTRNVVVGRYWRETSPFAGLGK